MSIKGYPGQEKFIQDIVGLNTNAGKTSDTYGTVWRDWHRRGNLTTVGLGYYRVTGGTVEALESTYSSTRVVKVTAHTFMTGDVLRFEQTSANPGFEAIISIGDANHVVLSSSTRVAIATGDTFYILRSVAQRFSSDGAALAQVSSTPIAALGKGRIAAQSTNITTAAYVQLVASSPSATEVVIDNTTGQTLLLAFGGSGSEVDQIYVPPSGLARQAMTIPAGTRLSVKAVNALANVGEVLINLFG